MSRHFVCGVDFEAELDHTLDFFNSIDELKAKKKCWPECGIVEVILDEQCEVVAHSVVLEPKSRL
jgi:hypothetical protein